jgi:membrane protease YdiL (CAAX protease family)
VYWLVVVICAGLAMVAVTTLAAVDFNGLEEFKHTAPAQRRLSQVFQPGGGAHIAGVVLACLLAGGAGVLCYLPGVRHAAARWLPLDPDSFVHATALATVAALTLMLFAPLAVLGEPPLLLMLRHFAENPELKEKMKDLSDPGALRDQVYAFAWLVPVGILSVGYPLHRTLPEALRRVGLVRPRAWQVLFGLLFAGVLVVVMQFGVDRLIGHLWRQQGWAVTDEKEFEQLLKFAINPLGAAVIGITAGVGEELFARGVLQPRLGILLSNLFFTALHAPQYNWDALASVFVIGLVLGLVRKGTNTTTSAIVHGTYDFVLVLLSYYAANG